MQPGILNCVAHHLRTRLATVSAAVDSLSDSEVRWTDDQRAELLTIARESLQQLAWLITELETMGSGWGGAAPRCVATRLRDVVARAVDDLGHGASRPRTDVPANLPPVLVDPSSLQYVIGSVLRHLLRVAPERTPAEIQAVADDDLVLLRIGDPVPIPHEWGRRTTVSSPRRLASFDGGTDLGPDVAVARGLTEAMGGALRPADPSGSGLTVVIELPAVTDSDDDAHARPLMQETEPLVLEGAHLAPPGDERLGTQ